MSVSRFEIFFPATDEAQASVQKDVSPPTNASDSGIVMPGLRGPELARHVAKVHPQAHIVYISGYAEGLPEAQIPANATFLQKPFRFATLLQQLKLVRRRV